MTDKGKPGFSTLSYKGMKLDRDVTGTSSTVYFQHIYRGGIFSTKGRHACLINGYWCWLNFRQHPFDIRYYLKRII